MPPDVEPAPSATPLNVPLEPSLTEYLAALSPPVRSILYLILVSYIASPQIRLEPRGQDTYVLPREDLVSWAVQNRKFVEERELREASA